MKHKIAMLDKLASMMHDKASTRIHSMKKPVVSIHVEKHEDEYPEEQLLHEKMESPLDEHKEEGELSIAGDGVAERRAMMKSLKR